MAISRLTLQNVCALRSFLPNSAPLTLRSNARQIKKLEELELIKYHIDNYTITEMGIQTLAEYDKKLMTPKNARIIAMILNYQPTDEKMSRIIARMPGKLQDLIDSGIISTLTPERTEELTPKLRRRKRSSSTRKKKSLTPSYHISKNFQSSLDSYNQAGLSII